MKKLSMMVAALAFSAAGPALAEGWYTGLAVGQSKADINRSDLGLSTGTVDDKDTSFGAKLGYEFGRHLGVEASYNQLGKYNFNGTFAGVPVSGDAKARSYDVSVLGILPFTDRFAGYGRLGYGRTMVDASASAQGFSGTASDWESEALYGAGLRMNIDKQWGVFTEYTRYDDTKIDNWTVGARVNF